jgi:hypothetical protein
MRTKLDPHKLSQKYHKNITKYHKIGPAQNYRKNLTKTSHKYHKKNITKNITRKISQEKYHKSGGHLHVCPPISHSTAPVDHYLYYYCIGGIFNQSINHHHHQYQVPAGVGRTAMWHHMTRVNR